MHSNKTLELDPSLDGIGIAVDLDGTFLRTDTLYECIASLLRHHPVYVLLLPFWMIRGKAYLKHKLAIYSNIDVESLPVNEELLKWLVQRDLAGNEIILATAADRVIAESVAKRVGLFKTVLASSETVNLSGFRKATAIRKHFSGRKFCYIGNAAVDLPIWSEATKAVSVDVPRRLENKLRQTHPDVKSLRTTTFRWESYFKAIRPHQWLKNVLIFLPVLASHHANVGQVVNALLAFAAFCLCASSVYLVNDLIDLADDRQHPTKKNRPLACGSLPLLHGMIMAPLLLLSALSISLVISVEFFAVLTLYLVVTFGYSLYIKRKVLADIVALSFLYTIRVIAGAVATTVRPSFWLLSFSVFLFFSLAIVKRCRELQPLEAAGRLSTRGRGYHVNDLPILRALGVGSALMSVLVLALYINSPHIIELYSQPYWLWGVCFLHMCWVSWVWILTQRNEIDDDPVVFSVTDPVSLALGIGVVILILLAL